MQRHVRRVSSWRRSWAAAQVHEKPSSERLKVRRACRQTMLMTLRVQPVHLRAVTAAVPDGALRHRTYTQLQRAS